MPAAVSLGLWGGEAQSMRARTSVAVALRSWCLSLSTMRFCGTFGEKATSGDV